jgi:hypothetical protein
MRNRGIGHRHEGSQVDHYRMCAITGKVREQCLDKFRRPQVAYMMIGPVPGIGPVRRG